VRPSCRLGASSTGWCGSPERGGRLPAALFDLLTGLLDSWTLWNNAAGNPEDENRIMILVKKGFIDNVIDIFIFALIILSISFFLFTDRNAQFGPFFGMIMERKLLVIPSFSIIFVGSIFLYIRNLNFLSRSRSAKIFILHSKKISFSLYVVAAVFLILALLRKLNL